MHRYDPARLPSYHNVVGAPIGRDDSQALSGAVATGSPVQHDSGAAAGSSRAVGATSLDCYVPVLYDELIEVRASLQSLQTAVIGGGAPPTQRGSPYNKDELVNALRNAGPNQDFASDRNSCNQLLVLIVLVLILSALPIFLYCLLVVWGNQDREWDALHKIVQQNKELLSRNSASGVFQLAAGDAVLWEDSSRPRVFEGWVPGTGSGAHFVLDLFLGPATSLGHQAFMPQVLSVGSSANDFVIRGDEIDACGYDEVHLTEHVSWLLLCHTGNTDTEQGKHEVGRVVVDSTKNVVTGRKKRKGATPMEAKWVKVRFNTPFEQVPIVFTQLGSRAGKDAKGKENARGFYPTRIRNVTATEFYLILQSYDDPPPWQAYVSYLAVLPGEGAFHGKFRYIAGAKESVKEVEKDWSALKTTSKLPPHLIDVRTPTFPSAATPALLAQIQTTRNSEGEVLHLRVAEKTRNMHGQSIYLAGANEFECEVDEGDLVDETIGYLIVDSTLKVCLTRAEDLLDSEPCALENLLRQPVPMAEEWKACCKREGNENTTSCAVEPPCLRERNVYDSSGQYSEHHNKHEAWETCCEQHDWDPYPACYVVWKTVVAWGSVLALAGGLICAWRRELLQYSRDKCAGTKTVRGTWEVPTAPVLGMVASTSPTAPHGVVMAEPVTQIQAQAAP